MDAMTKRVALTELRAFKAREAEYRAEREEWYRAGDGRSPRYITDPETGRTVNVGGKGYTFPYCEHGSSRWTDYDNICGGCEDGYSAYELAIMNAHSKMAEFNRRADWMAAAPASFKRTDAYREMPAWVLSALD